MKNLVGKNQDLLQSFNYVRKADPKADYWLDFSSNKLDQYYKQYGKEFDLIVWGDQSAEGDFYVIPYAAIKHIFVEEFFAADSRQRWIGRIVNHQLRVNNYPHPFDLVDYYGNPDLLYTLKNEHVFKDKDGKGKYLIGKDWTKKDETKQNDYAIENRKVEIEARQKQSKFRKEVLNNFQGQCCVSGITEEVLLVASHIIPWAKRIETRLDPSNGLCLSILYDKLFDKGYISFDENYQVIISQTNGLSEDLQDVLLALAGTKMRHPIKHPIKQEFLEFHRTQIFGKI